jgi:hypothetical protein
VQDCSWGIQHWREQLQTASDELLKYKLGAEKQSVTLYPALCGWLGEAGQHCE